MTHPSDIAGLSERLRKGAPSARDPAGWHKLCDEAATALDSLSARVKELEARQADDLAEFGLMEMRALRAEQQRDGLETQLEALSASHRDLASRLAAIGQQRDEAYERAANWRRRFGDPVPMPDGTVIKTIGEAARYAERLPQKITATPPWQRAVHDLLMAAEHPAWVFLARIAFYCAVHGDAPAPIGKVRETKAERFKAKRKAVKGR